MTIDTVPILLPIFSFMSHSCQVHITDTVILTVQSAITRRETVKATIPPWVSVLHLCLYHYLHVGYTVLGRRTLCATFLSPSPSVYDIMHMRSLTVTLFAEMETM